MINPRKENFFPLRRILAGSEPEHKKRKAAEQSMAEKTGSATALAKFFEEELEVPGIHGEKSIELLGKFMKLDDDLVVAYNKTTKARKRKMEEEEREKGTATKEELEELRLEELERALKEFYDSFCYSLPHAFKEYEDANEYLGVCVDIPQEWNNLFCKYNEEKNLKDFATYFNPRLKAAGCKLMDIIYGEGWNENTTIQDITFLITKI